MSEQNPYGTTPPAGQPYGTAQPPGYGPAQGAAAPQYGAVPPQAQPAGYPGAPVGGQPGYPGYGAYAPVPPRKSRKTLWILLGCLAGVIALIGGLLAYFYYDVTSDAGTHKIVLPAKYKDLTKDDNNPIAKQLQSTLTSEFGKGDGSWNPTGVSAVYQDSNEEPQVIVAGAYGKVLFPKQELDTMWKGMNSEGTTVSGKRQMDPGPMGGTLECAKAESSGVEFGVCAWADKSSLVMVMKTEDSGKAPDLDKLAGETRELRAVAEVPQ
ncbi:hypothetical protein ACWEQL_17020 [Kitasatospora sp. NPDC004240]